MRSAFRTAAAGLGGLATACAVIGVPASSAANRHVTTSGTIQVNVASTNNRAPVDLITGAIADHGTDRTGHNMNFEKVVLSKGTFEINVTKFNNSYKPKIDRTGCTMIGSLAATNLPVVNGTGAYTGITGSVSLKGTSVGIFPIRNGKCVLSANPTAANFIIEGSGHVAY